MSAKTIKNKAKIFVIERVTISDTFLTISSQIFYCLLLALPLNLRHCLLSTELSTDFISILFK